jgi:hypothetical protein
MTDKEVNYRALVRQAVQQLTNQRKPWEPAAPPLLPDYLKGQKLLADFDVMGTVLAGSQGYTDAKGRAEALAAAIRVVKGLRNVQLNTYRPALAQAAASVTGGPASARPLLRTRRDRSGGVISQPISLLLL